MGAIKHRSRWKLWRFRVPIDTQKNQSKTQPYPQRQMFRALHETHVRTQRWWEYTEPVESAVAVLWCLLQVLCTLVLPKNSFGGVQLFWMRHMSQRQDFFVTN